VWAKSFGTAFTKCLWLLVECRLWHSGTVHQKKVALDRNFCPLVLAWRPYKKVPIVLSTVLKRSLIKQSRRGHKLNKNAFSVNRWKLIISVSRKVVRCFCKWDQQRWRVDRWVVRYVVGLLGYVEPSNWFIAALFIYYEIRTTRYTNKNRTGKKKIYKNTQNEHYEVHKNHIIKSTSDLLNTEIWNL